MCVSMGEIIFYIFFQRTQFVITTVLKNLQDDKWHHILLTIASSFAEFYVDGEKLAAR